MPTYEYECSQCSKHFDYLQSMSEDPLTDCLDPECGGKGTMTRLIGMGAGIIFKGSGFYATDYKKSNSCGSSSKSSGKGREAAEAAPCACPHADSCPMTEKKD